MAAAAVTNRSRSPLPIHVAYFPDPVKLEEEAEPGYPSPSVCDMLCAADISFRQIKLKELLAGCLSDGAEGFTVLCVPGGFAPNYASRLGVLGASLIREFVAAGGGFVGLCAGAFLGCIAGLALLPVQVDDIHRWARGSGPCQICYTQAGCETLGALGPSHGPVTVRYQNGPLMRPCGSDLLTLATFATEFRGLQDGSRAGSRMLGTPAIVIGRAGGGSADAIGAGCGAGHGVGSGAGHGGVVALVSPHLEDGQDQRALTPLANLFRLASRDSVYQLWQLGDGGMKPFAGVCSSAFVDDLAEERAPGQPRACASRLDELRAEAEHACALQWAAASQIAEAPPEVSSTQEIPKFATS
mmetsp:Transcript_33380/g.87901  ORF Transcript_33380/g.87901 Transcript_33380/m.87901 type:complete len:356 (-) Transcript_33380:158-1225(-)